MYTFQEIRGNQSLLNQLKTAASCGKVSHAYLFLGGAGAGKRLIGNTFAKALQCTAVSQKPCGKCRSCVAFDNGNHPDVIYVRSEKKQIGVDDVREQILETVNLKPYQYPKKIYIIEEADTMNIQAQNALLKTLEEPPAYAVFLLFAQREDAFLPTMLSRMVRLKIRPLSEEAVAEYLIQTGLSSQESYVLAAYAQGRIGQALALKQEEAFSQMRQDILDKLEKIPVLPEGEVYLMAKELEEYKNDLRFLDIMELWYRDLLAAKSLKEERYLIQKDKKTAILRGANGTAAAFAKKAQAVRTARKRLLQNANFRLTIEVLLMELKEN